MFPAEAYLSEVFMPDLDLFRNLKVTWKVSIQLQIQRGVDLGIIGDEQAIRLWKNCMRRGWKLKEPYDDTLEVEEPRVLARSIQMLMTENVRSRFDIQAALPFSSGDILELVNLPGDYFQDRLDTIVSLKDFRANRESGDVENIEVDSEQYQNKVVEFKRRIS